MGPPGSPIFGTVFRFIFLKFFCIRVAEAQCLVSMKLCGTGADQCCSLPDSPGRPRAAKSAPMALSCGVMIRHSFHSLGEWSPTAEQLLLMSLFLPM